MILISPSIALLLNHEFNHLRKCLEVPIREILDSQNIWRIQYPRSVSLYRYILHMGECKLSRCKLINQRDELKNVHYALISAQLFLPGDRDQRPEAHHHLRQSPHREGRGADLRLQVPHRGCQDPLQLRLQKMPKIPQLEPVKISFFHHRIFATLTLKFFCTS